MRVAVNRYISIKSMISYKFSKYSLILSGIGISVLATFLLISCAKPEDDGLPILRVGNQRGGIKSRMLAAGTLKDLPYRIEWAEFPSAQTLLEALAADAVDFGEASDAPFLFAYESGSPIQVVEATRFVNNGYGSGILVRSDARLTGVSDLKGRTIATTRGSIGHYVVLRALENAKLGPQDVKLTFLPPSDAKVAFVSGAVDVWSIWNPYFTSAILRDGAKILPGTRGLAKGYFFQISTPTALKGKAALIADFTRRYEKARTWAYAHPEASAKMMATETGLPLDIALATERDNRRVPVALDSRLIADQQQTVDLFVQTGLLKAARPLRDAFATPSAR